MFGNQLSDVYSIVVCVRLEAGIDDGVLCADRSRHHHSDREG